MTRCHVCFEAHDAAHPMYICTTATCQTNPDESASKVLGVAVINRPTAPLVVTPAVARGQTTTSEPSCRQCRTQMSTVVCALCHEPFPPGWSDVRTVCISMAGSRSSGKSVYIAVLVKQLEHFADRLGGTVTFYDGEEERQYREFYERPLYDEARKLDATRKSLNGIGGLPLPMRLSIRVPGREIVLVLRDVPGENLQEPDLNVAQYGFFARSDAVFFLFDPLSVQPIRHILEGWIDTSYLMQAVDPHRVLAGLTRVMRGGAPPNTRVRVPLVVLLAKFDALQALDGADEPGWNLVMRNRGAAFQRDPSMQPHYDRDDGDLVQEETRALLERLDAGRFLGEISTSFETYRFAPVSALGHDATSYGISDYGIAPFRVLDPVKWLLDREGLLPTPVGGRGR